MRPVGRNDARAPVAEAVTIGRHRDRRVEHQIVAADEIGHAREVDVEVEDHRGGLRAVVDHFEADANLHHGVSGVQGALPLISAGGGMRPRAL